MSLKCDLLAVEKIACNPLWQISNVISLKNEYRFLLHQYSIWLMPRGDTPKVTIIHLQLSTLPFSNEFVHITMYYDVSWSIIKKVDNLPLPLFFPVLSWNVMVFHKTSWHFTDWFRQRGTGNHQNRCIPFFVILCDNCTREKAHVCLFQASLDYFLIHINLRD